MAKEDLTGRRFGKLLVIEYYGMKIQSNGEPCRAWLCKCDCGEETIVKTAYLTSGSTKSCGCLKRNWNKYNLDGKRFGNLTVIRESYKDQKSKAVVWLCKCDCGNYCEVKTAFLNNGRKDNCGCMTPKKLSVKGKRHGMYKSRIYSTWRAMKFRCNNPNSKIYKNYGGRGIKVCDEWQAFEPFYEWAMGNGYENDLTLDRKDVNGNYEPSNCRWITNKEQQRNKRTNRLITYKGMTKTFSEWSEYLGINIGTLKYRIDVSHWSIEKAFETPVKTKYRRKNIVE